MPVSHGHATAMLRPCYSHATAMLRPCYSHATATPQPCYSHATATLQPCYSHATATLRPRYGHATATLRPCYNHAAAMLQPCYSHANLAPQATCTVAHGDIRPRVNTWRGQHARPVTPWKWYECDWTYTCTHCSDVIRTDPGHTLCRVNLSRSDKVTTWPRRPLQPGPRDAISSQMTLDKETTW